MQEFQNILSEHGYIAPVASSDEVGAIPFYINGGVSVLTPLLGFACESILAANIVTPAGKLITATDHENPELLWAIRGHGTSFGLVTSLKIRIHRSTLLQSGYPSWYKQSLAFRDVVAIVDNPIKKIYEVALRDMEALADQINHLIRLSSFTGTTKLTINDDHFKSAGCIHHPTKDELPKDSRKSIKSRTRIKAPFPTLAIVTIECFDCAQHTSHPASMPTGELFADLDPLKATTRRTLENINGGIPQYYGMEEKKYKRLERVPLKDLTLDLDDILDIIECNWQYRQGVSVACDQAVAAGVLRRIKEMKFKKDESEEVDPTSEDSEEEPPKDEIEVIYERFNDVTITYHWEIHTERTRGKGDEGTDGRLAVKKGDTSFGCRGVKIWL